MEKDKTPQNVNDHEVTGDLKHDEKVNEKAAQIAQPSPEPKADSCTLAVMISPTAR